ncbi:MAG: DUF4381 domain-containing protein [Legionellaceae bacterium]
MPNNPALSQLRDIHLPHPVSVWPIAPGYYAITLALVLICVIIFFAHHYYQRATPKREALKQLDDLLISYQNHQDAQAAIAGVSMLLKRVALVYFPRATVASLHTTEWLNFLETHSKALDFTTIREALTYGPYQPTQEKISIVDLVSFAKQWIKQRRGQHV